jgi:hypothetical protein
MLYLRRNFSEGKWMLKIRFILLLGVLLGSALSIAAIKGRGHDKRADLKSPAFENAESRRPSGIN